MLSYFCFRRRFQFIIRQRKKTIASVKKQSIINSEQKQTCRKIIEKGLLIKLVK